eukprot:scaffold34690_cov288-Amphora_coffeaeformis.AAC.3
MARTGTSGIGNAAGRVSHAAVSELKSPPMQIWPSSIHPPSESSVQIGRNQKAREREGSKLTKSLARD